MSTGPERPPNWHEGIESRTEYGQAGPSYEDYPSAGDVGFSGAEPVGAPEVLEPIPVVVVAAPPIPTRVIGWRPFRVTVDDSRSVMLSGASKNRTRLFLRNTNAAAGNSVFLMADGTHEPGFGYELQAGDTLELFHNDDVWARCAATQTATVSVSGEYVLEG